MLRAAAAALTMLAALVALLPDAGPVLAAPAGSDLAALPGPVRPADAPKPLDTTNRWIVILRDGSNVSRAETRARGLGVAADRTFRSAIRGYAAKLTGAQVAALRGDPEVASVVPDGVISLTAQSTPTGVRRIGGPANPIAVIDGIDQRVDADVAIVDTGIDASHPDLNVVGGHNCSTSNPDAWQDDNGHGTHVAGTVGAIDNGRGVVGVAPGVRLWAVRILRADGSGLISWYVCGLDWIAAQRDPADPTRPLFEAVNMSVAKSGSDDRDCGYTNHDVMHQAICRVVGAGITVVAAAGNNSFDAARLIPASYNEVITVSALADTDGKPGGLGGALCYSWGSYDRDDTFADFSNYGHDVDLIAPGKCIWSTLPGNRYGYLSGTSMATPHVTGAVALYKASRPDATPAQVRAALRALGSYDWKLGTDPDSHHEPLLDVARLVNLGDFQVTTAIASKVVGGGASFSVPVAVDRAEDVDGEIDLSLAADPPIGASLADTSLVGLSGTSTRLRVNVPSGTPAGSYRVTVTATDGTLVRSDTLTVVVDRTPPVAAAPIAGPRATRLDVPAVPARISWPAATDSASAIAAYQVQTQLDGGGWGSTVTVSGQTRRINRTLTRGHRYAVRIRAQDSAGNWSSWATGPSFVVRVSQDRSAAWSRSGAWHRSTSAQWSRTTTRFSRQRGAAIWRSFTGRAVALVMPRAATRGKAQIWIDGALSSTVNLHRASLQPRRIVYRHAWSTSGRHTIRIVVLGTAGHPRVDLDALVIFE
jgi:subtilisin